MKQLYSLGHFGFLSVTGKDALKFLQGYTTCDLENLAEGQSTLGAICNIKGRMVSNFRVIETDLGFLLRLSRSLVTLTEDFLAKYIVFSKAELQDMSDIYRCFGLIDLQDDFLTDNNQLAQSKDTFTVAIDQSNRYEIWTPGSAIDLTLHEKPAQMDQWHTAEIAAGLAWIDTTSTDQYIPQMLNLHQTGGISFDKGCYLGQEIVARMQFRGNLTKRLHRGIASSPVWTGDKLFNSRQKSIGTVVAAQDPDFLAVIQTKSRDDGYLLANGSSVTVTDLTEGTN